jgi:PAS domain S-box-containing protein
MATTQTLPIDTANSELVLCVDDEVAGLEFRRMVLERRGYAVVTATSASQALEFFKGACFNLVITDHLLGRTTATAMIAEMKRLNPHVPIILLSGIAEIPDRLENVDAFVSKADGPAALLAKTEELIGSARERGPETGATPGRVIAIDAERTQELLAAIVESSDDAIFSKTLDGTVMSWNKAAQQMYGYSADEIVGRSVSILLPPDRPNEVHDILERLKRGEKIQHFETIRRAKDGHLLAVSLSVSPMYDSQGKVAGASTIARDITQTRMAEQALLSSERLASAGRMAATLAHEINNPLEAVTNILYLLGQTATWDENARGFVHAAQEEVEKIRQVTKLTLGFHRQSDVERKEVKVTELVDNILALYRRRIDSFGVAVDRRYDSPGVVSGIPAELRQVLANLILNGVDALRKTGNKLVVRVRNSFHWQDPAKRGVRITIADNGPGIPTTVRAHIFEPFYTTKGEEGNGMGLWVTRGIIEKYGGTIRFRSSVNPERSGTTFSVFLPCQEARAPMTVFPPQNSLDANCGWQSLPA